MKSDLISRVARLQKELLALKSGFGGNEKRFYEQQVTEKQFEFTTSTPVDVIVDFDFKDFPQFYATIYDSDDLVVPIDWIQVMRTSLYQWRLYIDDAPRTYIVHGTLISEQEPTYFEVV